MSGIALDYENLRDLMIRDQLLHVCNKDVLLFLKERVPKDIGEMSQLADRFKEARRANVVSLTNPNLRDRPRMIERVERVRIKGLRLRGTTPITGNATNVGSKIIQVSIVLHKANQGV